MASSSGFSKLQKKFGARLDKAVQAHANDPTDYGNIQLPAGIKNGIARVVSCTIDTYKSGANKDKDYLHLQAIVVQPEYITIDGNEVKVAGLRTRVQETLDDTKNQKNEVMTLEDHVSRALNYLRMLKGEDYTEGATGADLERLCKGLVDDDNPIYTRFSTSERKDYKTGKVVDGCWENWYGSKGLEDYEPPISSGSVEDDSGTEDDEEQEVASEEPPEEAPTTPKKRAKEVDKSKEPTKGKASPEKASEAKVGAKQEEPEPAGEDEEEPEDDTDEGDDDSSEGEDSDEDEGEDEASEEEPSVEVPQVKSMYLYTPIDPKTKKPVKKAVEVRVMAVDEKKQTVKIKNVDDNTTIYKDVPWSELKED